MTPASPSSVASASNDEHRSARRIGWAVLLLLGAFAWTYYLERTACADSAFFSWMLIDGGHPMSALGRYGSWLAQLPALALIWIGVSLDVVLRTYSVSLIVVHILVFWLVAFRLKDHRAAFVLPVMLTAGFHYMFYYGISELYQGLSLTILLWVVLMRAVGMEPRRSFILWSALALMLNVWISFYHQLLVLPLLFILVHEAIVLDRRGRERAAILGGLMVLWYVVRIKFMSDSTYEQSRMPTMHDLVHFGARLRELESTTYLLKVWTKFHGLLLLIAAGLIAGLIQRAWLRTLWTLTFSILFLLLALVVDREGKSVMIYENYYPVLGLVWAVHFVSVFMDGRRPAVIIRTVLFVLVCSLGLMQIHRGHHLLSEKVAYMQRITSFWEAQGRQKLLVKEGNFPWAFGLGIWPLGMETALAAAVKGPSYASTVFVSMDTTLLNKLSGDREHFLGPTWIPWFGIKALDERYFEFPVDTGYIWANTCDSFDLNKLVLRGPSLPFRLKSDRFSVVPIVIHNPTNELMHSCTADGTPVRMSYRLFHKDGTEYLKGTEVSALETDIPPGMTYHQGLVIERPKDEGVYWVLADLLIRDQPFGKYVTFDMVVD